MPAQVETSRLRVAFGPVVAVHSLDLAVQPGASVALVGRNGAGKSTTLRVLGRSAPRYQRRRRRRGHRRRP